MAQAIRDAQAQHKGEASEANLVSSSVDGDGMSLDTKVNIVVYTVLITALIYFVRRDFGHSSKAFMMRYFPRESQILGIGTDETMYMANSS